LENRTNNREKGAVSRVNMWYRVGSLSGAESGLYRVKLRMPADWKPVRGYEMRYGAPGGFVQLSAAGAGDADLERAAASEANHPLEPYGSRPSLRRTHAAGQEAYLILPSADQSSEMERQAALLVRYPRPVRIAGSVYCFLVLRSDEPHLEMIGNTLEFMV
jgi:TolB protein